MTVSVKIKVSTKIRARTRDKQRNTVKTQSQVTGFVFKEDFFTIYDHSDKKTIYITYVDKINSESVKMFINFIVNSIVEHKPDVLYFLLSTPGGDVSGGVTLYNFLKTIPQKVIMHNMGSVDSIGTIVFLAGEQRFAMPHSTFLFHAVEASFKEEKVNLKKIEEKKSGLLQDQEKIASLITENSSISKGEMNKLFEQGEMKSAEFAEEKKFIHEIKTIKLRKEDILLNFLFADKGNDK